MDNTAAKSARVEQVAQTQKLLRALDDAINKLEAVESAKTEPIAIVGLSCRFPGGASDPASFWQLLSQGQDAIAEVPSDRWNIDAFYDADPDAPGKMYTRWGGFLQQVDQFDAQFFGISPREAVKLDPQQRLLLEVSWEALEVAGVTPEQSTISQTGVFVGVTTNDYARLLIPNDDFEQLDAYYLTGNPLNAIAGRLSYTLGLQGPCLAIDTACSSSLVAVHTACQSLRNRECRQALAGGVNLILSPENTIALCKAKMMAPDGHCKTFDASANGIVRGEGCGILILKRLSDAIADGDNIWALIRGSAVNQDGASSGFTVPNKMAQEALIREALKRAKVSPLDVDYVEAHGTGTPLGDPIELRALDAVLGKGRSPDNPLKVGSVKTNIGHLESAAGVAGLIKVILALRHQQIPPHLHLQQLNPYINWDGLPIAVTTEAVAWQPGSKRRIAGVSSFGASGTNAHVIIEEAPSQAATPSCPVERPLHLLTLSTKTKSALPRLSDRYQSYLANIQALKLGDVSFTANTGRSHFKHRLAVIASSATTAAEKLAAFVEGQPDITGVIVGEADSGTTSKLAFLFTGQGSQYSGMGRQLYETQPTFRDVLNRCNEILRPYLDIPLLEVLYPSQETSASSTSLIDQTAYTQPALFAIEYALYQLWQSWGIEPDVVMGHSVGEYVAACVAGVFSLEDGLKLIAARGRLMQALPNNGAMVAVLASPEQVKPLLDPYRNQVAIAAWNGPRSLVISGQQSAVQSVCEALEATGVKTKVLPVSHAFHSPLMQPMLTEFRQVADQVQFHAPQLKLVSNLTGQLAGNEITTPEYWCRHILNPVQFASSMETLAVQGYNVFLEVGPKPILLGMGRGCIPEEGQLWLPSLRQGQDDWQPLLESLAQLYVRGVSVNWAAFERDYARQRVPLPTYPFQRQRFWPESVKTSRTAIASAFYKPAECEGLNPLLGQRIHLAGSSEIRFESHICQDAPAFLADHCIYGITILPATAYLEMALSAGTAVFRSKAVQLEQVSIQQALMLMKGESKSLQTVLKPEGSDTCSFQIFSLSINDAGEATSLLHAAGNVTLAATSTSAPIDLVSLKAQCHNSISVETYYQELSDRGFQYGPNFRAIEQLWKDETDQMLGQIRLPPALASQLDLYQLHPVLLDACFQVLGLRFPEDGQQQVYLPVGVEQLQVYGKLSSSLWSQVQRLEVKPENPQYLRADLSLVDEAGAIVATITGLSFRRVTQKAFLRTLRKSLPQPTETTKDWLYQVAWQAKALESRAPSSEIPGTWVIFTNNSGVGAALSTRLKERGNRSILVTGLPASPLNEDHYQVAESDPKDWQRLLEQISEANSTCRGIIYLCDPDEFSLDAHDSASLRSCGSVLHLVQALTKVRWTEKPRLWLVTQGAQAIDTAPVQVQQAPLWGLGRVIALEHSELRCARLDLDPASNADNSSALLQELLAFDREDQIAYRQGTRYVARLVPYSTQPTTHESQLQIPPEPFQLRISEYGVLENLTLVPTPRRSPGLNEVEIQVRAVGLNFRDVLNALGMLKEYTEQMGISEATDLPFGGECAGLVTAVGKNVSHLKVGDAVIAAQTIGSLSSYVVVPADFVVIKPESLSFEEAATIPTTFLTAYYGLFRKAGLKAGDRVLIHAAAGGVGQAAVQLAQQVGAEIFATASPSKWDFLKSQGVPHVMNSRSLEFADQVKNLTSGQGVDVVLNSLNSDYIPKNLEALGQQGRFIEIGKLGIWDEQQMQETRSDVAYFPFDLLDISLQTPKLIAELLSELMQAFEQGALKPLPHKVFQIQEAVNAFRYMAQSRHIGKVVVSVPDLDNQSGKKVQIRSNSTYLITGGLGALGLKVAEWLVERGARHLVLTGRRDLSDAMRSQVNELEQTGAKIWVAQTDVADRDSIRHLLSTIKDSMPPLRGIVHAAGVLEDGMLMSQTWESFNKVMAPKVAGTWNLHSLTEDIPLDFFVCFSSISALLGSPGQGNYAAANAFMDALAHHRKALGLPATSINWGPWGEVGMAATLNQRDRDRLSLQGIKPIPLKQGLQVLGDLLEQPSAQVGVLPVDWTKFLARAFNGVEVPFLEGFTTAAESQSPEQKSAFRQQLEAAPASEHPRLLITFVRDQVAKVLNLSSMDDLDPNQGFLDLGMDSLMAVELTNRLQTSLSFAVPASVMFDYPTMASLVEYLVQELLPSETESSITTQASEATAQPNDSQNQEVAAVTEVDVDQLSDSEAEALLMSKLDSMRY